MVKIEYNKEGGYVCWEVSGKLDKQDFFDSMDQLAAFHKEFKDIVVLQVDKGATVDFGPIVNIQVAKYANKYFSLFSSIKFAFVTDKSKSVAFFILATTSLLSSKLDAKVFSTKETAIEWL